MGGTINPRVEMRVGAEWVDITRDVRVSDDITISRGRRDEASSADPTTCSLVLNNRHGRYSPRLPTSPYYGLIGRNTPVRVRVGSPPAPPAPALTDAFGRTVTGGWGQADTGQAWTIHDGPASAFSVAAGAASITLDTIQSSATGAVRRAAAPVDLADVEVTARVRTTAAAVGEAYSGVAPTVHLRHDPATGGEYTVWVIIGTDTGRTDGGLRVATLITAETPAGRVEVAPVTLAPGVVAQAGAWLRIRVQAIGPELRARVWPDGGPEPEVWHAQGYDTRYLGAGGVALGGLVTADETPLPLQVQVGDLAVGAPPAADIRTRFVGEVSEWPMRWDLSGADIWVPITASGILRRLSQGAAPAPSPLATTIPAHRPLAYWPLEDGPDTGIYAASGLEDGQPLRVQDLRFGETDGPAGSGPLPEVGLSGQLVSPPIPMRDTGAWEVDMLYYLADDDFPSDEAQILGVTSTGTATRWEVTLRTQAGQRLVRIRGTGPDGQAVVDGGGLVTGGAVAATGAWRQLRLNVRRQSGSTLRWSLYWLTAAGAGTGYSGTATGRPGRVGSIATEFGNAVAGRLAVGHLSVWGAPTTTAYAGTMAGLPGETARQRITRLSSQAGVPMVVTGAAATAMGPQPAGTYLDLVGECVDADGGMLTEQRAALGLAYRSRDTLYNAGRAPAGSATEET